MAYQRERVHEVHRYGSAMGWFGHIRRLHIPEQPARSEGTFAYKLWRRHVAHLENEAINFRIQNAASYVTGLAMLDCESDILQHYGLRHVNYHAALANNKSLELKMPLLIGEVHDDLVFDCPKKEVRNAQRLIKDAMTGLVSLRKLKPEFDITVNVSQSAGSHWGTK